MQMFACPLTFLIVDWLEGFQIQYSSNSLFYHILSGNVYVQLIP